VVKLTRLFSAMKIDVEIVHPQVEIGVRPRPEQDDGGQQVAKPAPTFSRAPSR
jgi:hypothetical protein